MKIILPENVEKIINILNRNSFEAYAVGGCIRDTMLGLNPNDWDICTSALPEQTKSCFSEYQMFDSGIKHGTISVVIEKTVYEITTFRIDGSYSDNRRPDSVTFTGNIEDDLARRDFTVNAMAYNHKRGLIDPFNGEQDLKNKLIRCVGNPDARFNEDALRILRALRFASTYGMALDKAASESVLKNSELLNNIAVERISSELNRLICGASAEKILNTYRDVFSVFIPELVETFDFEQHNKHHNRDVWRHITHSVGIIEPNPLLRLTMLFHDIGKPRACTEDENGSRHFKGHQQISADMAREIFNRLKYPNDFKENCLLLIVYHDVRYNGTKKQIKHILNKIGTENMHRLFKVQTADTLSQSEYMRKEKIGILETAHKQFEELMAENACFSLRSLAINGRDLIDIGITDGKQIGSILHRLLNLVIDEDIPNKKSALLQRADELRNNN